MEARRCCASGCSRIAGMVVREGTNWSSSDIFKTAVVPTGKIKEFSTRRLIMDIREVNRQHGGQLSATAARWAINRSAVCEHGDVQYNP